MNASYNNCCQCTRKACLIQLPIYPSLSIVQDLGLEGSYISFFMLVKRIGLDAGRHAMISADLR